MSSAIDVEHLVVSFSSLRAVNDVSFHVNYGEVVILLGPNGAGKTTTVETLLGFRLPHAGTVRLHGRDPIRDHHHVVVTTGALLQRGGVWAPMSPRDVVNLSASYYESPRNTEDLLTLLDLARCATTPWRRLSGGEQQRTLLALALLGRPTALVLDEPTTSVDPEGRQVIRDIIASERDRGCALLITTHELSEAERLAQRLVIMHQGRVISQGSLDELAGSPEMIIETSGPVNPNDLSSILHCPVTIDGDQRLRCAVASTPERIALVSEYLSSHGLAMTSLRTRASLEERYLELITDERSGANS
jgi:ABC-2 type transport system ATP-binding protein